MKVLLVNPPLFNPKTKHKTYAAFPNGILYLAAVLEQHSHEVQVYDNVVDSREPKDFVQFEPDVVGFSVATGPDIDAAIAQSIEFKKVMPWVRVIWGGIHPSLLPEQTLTEPYIDYVVIGAGEYTLLELVQHLENGPTNLEGIKGLAHKRDGRIIINEPRPFVENLDELPDPAWHLVDVKKYWDITLNTSRGCPYRCTFCYNNAFYRGYRAEMSPQRIVSQVQRLKKEYGAKYIKIWEDNFTFNTKRLREFCQLVKGLRVKWDTETRASLTEEDIALMAESGCVSAGLGLETGSQRMLDFMKKAITVREMEHTFWTFVRHKVMPRIYLICGLPTETNEDFKMTQKLLRRLDYPPYTLGKFIPYPGTALINYCMDCGLFTAPEKLGDWADFTNRLATKVNLSRIPQDTIDESMTEFKRSYAIRPVRFAFRHNKSYFLSAVNNPLVFFRTLRNLLKYYLMILSGSSRDNR